MISIKISTDTKKLDKKVKSIGPITKRTLEQMGRMEVNVVQNRIGITKTSPEGNRWAPWALSTLRQRTRQGTVARGLLFNTGQLFRSIYYKVKGLTLEIGSSAPYASYLQEGTNNMPARPFIGFSKIAINRFKQLLSTELNK